MEDVCWFIKRKHDDFIFIHTGSWWRARAWLPIEKAFPGKTRRQLRKSFVAVKARIVPLAKQEET